MKETAIVICPGRGTYSKPELGYFGRYHGLKSEFLDTLDAYRGRQQQVSISDLDGAATFSSRRHTTGDNASLLIYACALADFADINQNQFDIVGVTGNSMGWYLALACAGVLGQEAAMHLVNTMGVLM
ncbi:MAG: ACP S-malonyltransferase, partial [Gammaproteobacteria bacterium]|nr:ACP S-malonyltransferase [Gammaproteobacteria bacterium]